MLVYFIPLGEGMPLNSLTTLLDRSLGCFLPSASSVQGLSPISSSTLLLSRFSSCLSFSVGSSVGYLLLEGTSVLLNEMPFKDICFN